MTRAVRVDDDLVSIARDLAIDSGYIRGIVKRLTDIGSSPLGFRNTGTDEDRAVAEFVSAEMRGFGLVDVAVEDVDVDAWRFTGAAVRVAAVDTALTIDGCSLGGVPPTPVGGVTGPLVDVRDPTRRRLDKLRLDGAIALVDWAHASIGPATFALELARRGVVGIIANCPPGGPYFQSPGALGTFDGHWPVGAPPLVMIRKEDAAELRAATGGTATEVTMTLDVEVDAHAAGHNIVGYLPGELPGPIVVGAHHDAWFRGAFDNTSGVAALLGIAKAMTTAGIRPRHTICFTSRTAEEYGITDSVHDWCIGAWQQISQTHPEWATESPFHLCLEASGHPALRTIVVAPVELAAWARRICKAADAEGWLPTGWRIAPPGSGTEQWPYLISGVPGVAAFAWETSFAKSSYHTQLDTPESIDTDLVAAQAHLYALLLLSADRDPGAALDHKVRARQLAKIADGASHSALADAAEQHQEARGRDAFTPVGRSLLALDAHSGLSYPHQQSLADLGAIDTAIEALDAGDPAQAARALSRVGNLSYFPYLSHEAYASYICRYAPEATARSWGSACHLTQSPDLWAELASLKGDTDAQPHGAWVRASLIEARMSTQRELDRRLDAMARELKAIPKD